MLVAPMAIVSELFPGIGQASHDGAWKTDQVSSDAASSRNPAAADSSLAFATRSASCSSLTNFFRKSQFSGTFVVSPLLLLRRRIVSISERWPIRGVEFFRRLDRLSSNKLAVASKAAVLACSTSEAMAENAASVLVRSLIRLCNRVCCSISDCDSELPPLLACVCCRNRLCCSISSRTS